MAIWDKFLTEQDKTVYEASGYGKPGGFGNRPAVVVVDVNYAFVGERNEPILESMKKWRTSCGSVGWDAIPHLRNLIDAARVSRIPVFYSTGIPPRPDQFDRGAWTYKNRRGAEDRSSPVAGVRGNDIVAEIAPAAHEFLIQKQKPSIFFGTPLPGYLVDLGVDTLIVCGTTTSGCVRATVLDGFNLNYRISVVEECTFDRFESTHAMNLFDMNAKYADVVGVGEAMAYMRALQPGLYDNRIVFPRQELVAAKN
jgi:maleamate amidohydrolase